MAGASDSARLPQQLPELVDLRSETNDVGVCEPAACSQALPSCLCLAGLQYVDGLGKL